MIYATNPRRRRHRARRRRNPESRSQRRRAARKGWRSRRRYRVNPSRRHVMRRRHRVRRRRNPFYGHRAEHSMDARRGWRHRRSRRYLRHRRNPGGMGIGNALKNGAIGAVGTLVINGVTNEVNKLIGFTGMTGDAVQLAGAVFIPALLSKFLKGSAETIQLVATGYILTKVANQVVGTALPSFNLSALMPTQPMGALMPASGMPMSAQSPAYEYDLNG